VWEIRIVCTDIVGTAIRWNSYSMTVFHEGTIRPNFRSQVAIVHALRRGIRFQDRLNSSRSGTVGA